MAADPLMNPGEGYQHDRIVTRNRLTVNMKIGEIGVQCEGDEFKAFIPGSRMASASADSTLDIRHKLVKD